MEFSSKVVEKAVSEIALLPGIGKRTALRMVLHLLKQPKDQIQILAESIEALLDKVIFCESCHNLSDHAICEVCANPSRNHRMICVVEDVRDVMAIENTGQYKGIYHVLGGKISPMDGIGPSNLHIASLIEKVNNDQVDELIFALSPTMEGDTTNYYIYKQIKEKQITLTTIARGISVGDELEYADEVTLARSIQKRVPFELL